MKLDKGQWSQIQQTLLGAFDRNNLRMMLRLELDVDLDTVAGDEDLATVVFNLIGWAERNNRVSDLLVGAAKYNPGNAGLQQLAADYPSWEAMSVASGASPAPALYPSAERSWGRIAVIGVFIVAVLGLGGYLLWLNFGPDILPDAPSTAIVATDAPTETGILTVPDATAAAPDPAETGPADDIPTPGPVPSFAYDFDDGQASGWTGDVQAWRVLFDENEGYVYQGGASEGGAIVSEPPAKDAMAAWTDYAVELRLRALEPVTDTDLSEAWLSLRAAYGPGSECELYNVYFDFLPQTVSVHKVCNSKDAPIQRNGFPLDFDEWYEARIEVKKDSLRVWVEGVPVIAAQDGDVAQGYLYFSVGTGATVQFDDIRIYRILPDVEE